MSKIINLYGLPHEVMLILEHPSGVTYENQVGGTLCWQATVEGLLAPVDLDPDAVDQIMKLPYDQGRGGISAEIADAIDAVLAASPRARYLKTDRARLAESWEAWVFVVADTPATSYEDEDTYFGAPRGFGRSTGVLTWPNSD